MTKIAIVGQSLVYRRQCRRHDFRNLRALVANNQVIRVVGETEIANLGRAAFRAAENF